MSLLLDAAVCWKNMLDISYTFVIGHKWDTQMIQLQFQPDEFAHLSGFHYVTDVDFHLPRQALYGKKLMQAVISGKIQEASIEKSTHWDKVSQRLQDILFLEKILDDDFQIFQFHAYKLPFHSKIDANYLVYSTKYQTGIFLFIDREQSRDYCRSIFSKDSRDYTINQTQWTILEKESVRTVRKNCYSYILLSMIYNFFPFPLAKCILFWYHITVQSSIPKENPTK